jgi:serine/threonine protein kinase
MSESLCFDNYELLHHPDGSLHELGRGAMGVTYKARDTDLHCDVALKIISPDLFDSVEVRERFAREARAAAKLRHPNIATVFRLGVTPDGTHYYAMEFCDGQTLQQALAAWGPLPPANALHLAWQVSKALRVAEQHRLIHRDLKPANLIVIDTPDDGLVVKVIDFGLAKSFADGNESLASHGVGFAGTAHFASPEQLEEQGLDIRSDIYSLGVCLWFMLDGRPPFSGPLARVMSQALLDEPPWERLAAQPPAVLALLRRMLAKKREHRPPTAAALRVEMEQCMAAVETSAEADEMSTVAAPKAEAEVEPSSARRMPIAAAAKGADMERLTARFALGERVGRDPLGRIFRAIDREQQGKVVTYRVIDPSLVAVPVTRRELEAQIAAACAHHHPGLVNALASAPTAQGLIVVTEKIEGFTLLEVLKHRGALPPHEALLLLGPLAAAADHAALHQLRGFSLRAGQAWVHFTGITALADRPAAPAQPADTWPPHALKVEAISLGGSAGGDATALQSLATLATAGHGLGIAPRAPATALAQLASELLGGSAATFTPIPRLSEEANTILRRACTEPTAFPTAAAFVAALRPALGKPAPAFSYLPRSALPEPPPPPVLPSTPIPESPASRRRFGKPAVVALTLLVLGLGYFFGIRAPRERAREDRRRQAEAASRDLHEKQRLAEVERLKIEAEKAQAEAAKAQTQMEEVRFALGREAATKTTAPAPQVAALPPSLPSALPGTPEAVPASAPPKVSEPAWERPGTKEAAEADRANAELDQVYKRLMESLGSQQQTTLREEERAWIAWRDEEITRLVGPPRGGSGYRVDYLIAMAGLTQKRIMALSNYRSSMSAKANSLAAISLSGERYPETRTRLLKPQDIQTLSDDKLRYAINEMFARRGAEFGDKDLKKVFSKLPWYRPVAGKTYEAAEREFTPIEEQNLKLLGALRDQRVGRPAQPLPGVVETGVPATSMPTTTGVATGPRYRGKGRVYKVPELKTLAGQRLENAWLYGDFLFKGHNGNVGYFITTAIVLLPKEGSTQLQVEFPDGIELSQTVLNTLRDPMLVIPVRFQQGDPVLLLSVSRQNDGRLVVRARARGALHF